MLAICKFTPCLAHSLILDMTMCRDNVNNGAGICEVREMSTPSEFMLHAGRKLLSQLLNYLLVL